MLTTLIYRSQVNSDWAPADLQMLVDTASRNNTRLHLTGILLFNGGEFFQVLEGEEAVIEALFTSIRADTRHCGVVELMRDYSAYRRFHDMGMNLIDLRRRKKKDELEKIRYLSLFRGDNSYDDRMFRLIRTFIEHGGRYIPKPEFSYSLWTNNSHPLFSDKQWPKSFANHPCQFALQPIIHALSGKISSYEALIRSASGGSPEEMFKSIPPEKLYAFDLESKAYAFALGGQMLKKNDKIAVNLLPRALCAIPDAVDTLLKQVREAGLKPEQVIIEVTEAEFISAFDVFYQTLKEIRTAGLGLAIDDFGAGYSGLTLLTRFQPDKIKLDMALVRDIHLSGVKQAVVASIVRCCEDLGITIIAEGVEKMEEWCWLQSNGIHLFQGFLFSRPCLNDAGNINWPVRIVPPTL